MKNVVWTARYLSAPTAVRYCKHCGAKATFASSGLFRVNAQQKALDVWLIFKCIKCDTTWNLTVFSRVNPSLLSQELLHSFYTNDDRMSMQYATDVALIKKNGAEPGIPEIEITGEQINMAEPAHIELSAEWPSELKAAVAIRSKLGLSRTEFEKHCSSGKLLCMSGQNLKKCKLTGTIIIELR